MAGFQGGRFSAVVGEIDFFVEKSVIARRFLAELDIVLAVATSGWRISTIARALCV